MQQSSSMADKGQEGLCFCIPCFIVRHTIIILYGYICHAIMENRKRKGIVRMKIIGLLGGMSWESTVTYYQLINEAVKEKLGGLHSAKILLYSVDFQEIEACQAAGDWERSAQILADGAKRLQAAGADFLVICTNTMHKVVPQIESQIQIPILHIAEATAEELNSKRIKKAALLGTKYTMQQDFYKQKLKLQGIEVLIPEEEDMELVNRVIYEELCLGIIREESRKEYARIMQKLIEEGAEGIILGCTEIGLLIKQKDAAVPVFDTTWIHARKAALMALEPFASSTAGQK